MLDGPGRPGFNHNDFYHRYLLRRVPPGCGRALDVGCGTGVFARRLASRASAVDALDRSAEVIETARTLSAGRPGVRYLHVDLAAHDLGEGRYDYIAALASLHHLPLTETISRLYRALAPGGVLAVLGCYRQVTFADRLPDVVAVPTNLVADVAVRLAARVRGRATSVVDAAPVSEPRTTLAEIRRTAELLLPAVVIRRHLFWRYSLFARRPAARSG
ncbi:SAM-dependent methyltransferase [Actinoalloteichus hoggarensis]|uniref:Ubiquinone biosynthesis O-methyltransferase n=1 Tax=Actinoalloteichus hoggarensis TaxID=1470176 RepID=A0A221W2T9_9PSEU|nr:class I SAM-dependent methyltransferase [Actinoalloteichus hoggarensis]ASO20095.1 Ubiquinone biosynthesis O-methyltransferase [Actinoalloteichus hoggarensis]MBB5919193.1 SAM-dependent methyltransferase [Actinoalloteichus hoggarensis]